MPIDPFSDRLLTRQEVVKFMSKRLRISVNRGSVIRWMLNGSGGVKLESVKIAGKRLTTEDCLRRFFEAIQEPKTQKAAKPAAKTDTTPRRPRKARVAAAKKARPLEHLARKRSSDLDEFRASWIQRKGGDCNAVRRL